MSGVTSSRLAAVALLAAAGVLTGCGSGDELPFGQSRAAANSPAAPTPDEPMYSSTGSPVEIPTQTTEPPEHPWSSIYCQTENPYFLERCFPHDGNDLLAGVTTALPDLSWTCRKKGDRVGGTRVTDDRECYAVQRSKKHEASYQVSINYFVDSTKVSEVQMVAGVRAFQNKGQAADAGDVKKVADDISDAVFDSILPDQPDLREQIHATTSQSREKCAANESIAFEDKDDLPIGYTMSCHGVMPIEVSDTTVRSFTMSMALRPTQERP